MNPLAIELNVIIQKANPHIFDMLSDVGKSLYFPKGILTQSAEAKAKAHKFNATIGMATEKGKTMYLSSVMSFMGNISPEESLTYAPSYGTAGLRKAWKDYILDKNPPLKDKKISLPVVTNAITHGLSVVADMWVDKDDIIIIPDKNWGNYSMIFETRSGGKIVKYPLFSKEGGFNTEGLKQCIEEQAKTAKKLMVLLNFPNNPTGYSITNEEGEKIANILTEAAEKGTNVVAVTDDAYFGLFFEENVMKESIFSHLIGRHPRLFTIKLDGATKEIFVWGLRVGFITYGAAIDGDTALFYDALERKTAGDVRGNISNVSHLSQTIVAKSLASETFGKESEVKFGIMKERANEVKKVLSDKKYDKVWAVYPFNSGYFMCLKLKTVDAEALRVHILDKYGVGTISIGKTDLRIAFSCLEKEDIKELFDIIYKGIIDLEK
ncbi:MAG: aminotransferase class I/II-fold pyridoxal phosphate-dependent enzyme [Desulfatiglans sp.]|jgi:aspartate/methionine/tyrosine aminotransferase|nr:aminotransferase class I/II-fold pyridoxal phosphate-dependent enzyme [Desulfatiglans sp.]